MLSISPPPSPRPRADDIALAVLGTVGAGKSTFVQHLVGQVIPTSNSLEIAAITSSVYRCPLPDESGRNLILFDGPGLDDPDRSDTETLRSVLLWSSKFNIPLTGVLYFLRISDNRMSGTSIKQLTLLRTLFQSSGGSLSHLVLVTSMNDLVDPVTRARREEALRVRYWEPMIRRGSRIVPSFNTPESAREIVLSMVPKQRVDASGPVDTPIAIAVSPEVTRSVDTSLPIPVDESRLSQLITRANAIHDRLDSEAGSEPDAMEPTSSGGEAEVVAPPRDTELSSEGDAEVVAPLRDTELSSEGDAKVVAPPSDTELSIEGSDAETSSFMSGDGSGMPSIAEEPQAEDESEWSGSTAAICPMHIVTDVGCRDWVKRVGRFVAQILERLIWFMLGWRRIREDRSDVSHVIN